MSRLTGIARIHTDGGGKLWVRAEGDARCVGGIDDFLQSSEFRYCSQVWVVGSRHNAEAITEIWPYRSETRSIRIGSPGVCLTSEEREDPGVVLSKMDELIGAASSVGGFHTMTHYDYTVYQLVATVDESHYLKSSTARHLIKYHPAWPALSFIPTLDVDQACLLLSRIVDPRWFVSPGRPNRLQRLYTYLGLHDVKSEFSGYNATQALTARESWSSLSDEDPLFAEDPSNFLWRIVEANGYSNKGYYLATRKFVQFIRGVWLDNLVSSKSFDGWFVPEYFFSRDDEIAAFRKHRARFKQRGMSAV